MTTITSAPKPSLLRVVDRRFAATLVLGGLAGLVLWEVFARGVAPLLIGGPLQPSGLVRAVFGIQSAGLAETIHILTGLLAFPIGWVLVARPVQRAILPGLPLWLAAVGYGTALWVVALYVLAHLVAGMPPFLGFGPLAFASLAGHLLYALGLAYVIAWREAKA